MRMLLCYLDCHEAGLCCYLVTHIENLLHLWQPLYLYLWPICRLSLAVKHRDNFSLPFTILIVHSQYLSKFLLINGYAFSKITNRILPDEEHKIWNQTAWKSMEPSKKITLRDFMKLWLKISFYGNLSLYTSTVGMKRSAGSLVVISRRWTSNSIPEMFVSLTRTW
jgi:hypothetical protein